MNRRSFLSSILAFSTAPAIVRADSLMRIVPQELSVALPEAIVTLDAGETWLTFHAGGLLVSDTIPGAVRNVVISAKGHLSFDVNPGELPFIYRNFANSGYYSCAAEAQHVETRLSIYKPSECLSIIKK